MSEQWIAAALGDEPKNVPCGWLSWRVASLHRWGLCDSPALMLLVSEMHLEKSTASEKLTRPPCSVRTAKPELFSVWWGLQPPAAAWLKVHLKCPYMSMESGCAPV